MSAANVPDLLQEWHQLTLEEGAALRARDWNRAAACQASKAGLQSQIDGCGQSGALDDKLRQLVVALMALEQENQNWLRDQLAGLRRDRSELEGSARNLKRVRSSYGRPSSVHWHSYC